VHEVALPWRGSPSLKKKKRKKKKIALDVLKKSEFLEGSLDALTTVLLGFKNSRNLDLPF
jgi:hypothetical protein